MNALARKGSSAVLAAAAVAVLAAGCGATSSGSAARTSAPPSSVAPAGTATTAAVTTAPPTHTAPPTSSAPVRATAAPTAHPVVAGAAESFVWSVRTYGRWVEVQGRWTGTSTVSGGATGPVVQPDELVPEYQLLSPDAATYTGSDAADAGADFRCAGARAAHSAALPTVWFSYDHPGSHVVTLASDTCGGVVDSEIRVTSGTGDPFATSFASTLPATAALGSALLVRSDATSPLSSPYAVLYALSPSGKLVVLWSAGGGSADVCGATDATTLAGGGSLRFDEAGTWTVTTQVGCVDDHVLFTPTGYDAHPSPLNLPGDALAVSTQKIVVR